MRAIQGMTLVSSTRLSVQGVSEAAFDAVVKLGERGGWDDLDIGGKPAKKATVKASTSKRKRGKKSSSPDPLHTSSPLSEEDPESKVDAKRRRSPGEKQKADD